MKRTLIQQGSGGYTVYVPKKWVQLLGLKAGDEIDVQDEENKLIIRAKPDNESIKTTELFLDYSNHNIYRSLIGGFYRGGYDEIRVKFSEPKVLTELQKSVKDLYGLEIFDIKRDCCTIKMIYKEETVDLRSHINRMVHTIKAMQETIDEDIKNKEYDSEKEMHEFSNNVLKIRDLIIRTIVQQKLLDNKHFPYHTIAYNLWHIARNYYHMYLTLVKKIDENEMNTLNKTQELFNWTFDWAESDKIIQKNNFFDDIFNNSMEQLQKKGKVSGIMSYCMNIMLLVQSCNSALMLLNY